MYWKEEPKTIKLERLINILWNWSLQPLMTSSGVSSEPCVATIEKERADQGSDLNQIVFII